MDEKKLLENLRIVLKNGVTPDELKSKGLTLSDELLKKAAP